MTIRPILYSFRRCPYAMRARLALLASCTICEIREVKLSAKPAEMVAASPKATVPVLVLPDGEVIDESLDIMRWALDRRDPDDWLGRSDAALIDANDTDFKRHLDRYKYPERNGSDAIEHRHAALEILANLETRLATNGFVHGDRIGLTDAAILPFVRQYAAVDRAWFAMQPIPSVRRWLDAFLASDLLADAMVRLVRWRPGDTPIFYLAR